MTVSGSHSEPVPAKLQPIRDGACVAKVRKASAKEAPVTIPDSIDGRKVKELAAVMEVPLRHFGELADKEHIGVSFTKAGRLEAFEWGGPKPRWWNEPELLDFLVGLDLTGLQLIRWDGNEEPSPTLLGKLEAVFEHKARLKTVGLQARLTSLPAGLDANAASLHTINFGRNRLRVLPEWIMGCTELRFVRLFMNELSDLPVPQCALPSLNLLDIRWNQFRRLPNWLWEFGINPSLDRDEKRDIWWDSNPVIDPPPEILRQGLNSVRSYVSAKRQSGSRPLREMKVTILGDSAAGKTTLSKALRGEPTDSGESSTHGINIDLWRFNLPGEQEGAGDYTVRVWDFGGQEIMHSTHTFFLSERNIVIVVLNARGDQDRSPEYWLKHIQTYAGDSPVFIVVNKIEENPGYDQEWKKLKERFPTIHPDSPFRVGALSGIGMDSLRSAMQSAVMQDPFVQADWPVTWFEVKEAMSSLRADYVGIDAFESICRQRAVESSHQGTVLEALHQLGVALHYPFIGLDHMQVLKPEWATDGAYKLLMSDAVEHTGFIVRQQIHKVLANSSSKHPRCYPPADHLCIVALMERFELAHRVSDGVWLLPSRLPMDRPEFEFEGEEIHFRFAEYSLLPRSVIERFIVRMYSHIVPGLHWRKGAVLSPAAGREGSWEATAWVDADEDRQRVDIRVIGADRREYLAVIRTAFEELHIGYPGLHVERKVVLHAASGSVEVGYDDLKFWEQGGMTKQLIRGLDGPLDVSAALGGLRPDVSSPTTVVELARNVYRPGDSEESWTGRLTRYFDIDQLDFYGVKIKVSELFKDILKWDRERRAG